MAFTPEELAEARAEIAAQAASRPRRRQSVAARRHAVYGLDATAYKVLHTRQNGLCGICDKPKELVIDHDHDSGLVRGLLCHDCNTSLGKLGDTVEGILRALAYLRSPPQQAG